MTKKPTYEELQQRVKELEKEAVARQRVEEALRESEERFRNFLDNLGDAAYEVDSSGNITYGNKAGEIMTGVPLKDIMGKPFLPLFIKESQKTAIDVFQRTLDGESPAYELTFTNGTIGHFKNEPLRHKNGKIVGVFGIARDITERRRAEEALEQKNSQLNSLINSIPDMAWLKDADSRFIAVNRAFGEAVGMDPESLLNQTCEVCFGKEASEKFHEDDQKVMKGRRQVIIEEKIVGFQKNEVWLETIKSPIFDESGKPVGTVGIARDISDRKRMEEALREARDGLEKRVQERTAELVKANEQLQREIQDRKKAEKALRASEEEYGTLVEDSLTGIYIDQDGKIVYANRTLAEIYGYSREELAGMESWKLVHPEDRPLTDAIRRKRVKGEEAPAEYEARGLTKDGETRWIVRRNTRIEYQGRPAILGNVVDVTERKRAEEALVGAKEDWENTFDAITDMVMLLDDEHRIVRTNTSTAEAFNTTEELRNVP
jgi:PAS domain S-box-containing protein